MRHRLRAIVIVTVLAAALVALRAMESPAQAAVAVSVTPAYNQLPIARSAQFTAQVSGTADTRVRWQVNNIIGGSSAAGTISPSGLYTAPSVLPVPAFAAVTAVSQADPAVSATATITLVAQRAIGKTYFVATTGNNANPGTAAAPWRTIQYAATKASAGDTVYVRPGVYNERVRFQKSGNATAGYITFRGQAATIDGTGLTIPGGQWGLATLSNVSYVVVNGFAIRNYQTANWADVPIGVYVFGAGNNIQLINNNIHDIKTTGSTTPAQCRANALGVAVYGSKAPQPISGLVISGNRVHHLKTGCSESLTLAGNVKNFAVVSNWVYNNDNIGIDAIGFEQVSPDPAYDQARDGVIRGNRVFNITSYGNPAYGNEYAAGGIYVDGGKRIVIEQNLVHHADIGIELASEHFGRNTSYVKVRNNLIYYSNVVGLSIGGYDAARGGVDHCTIVNNTLFRNDTKLTGSGEFQIQFRATANRFENNILYANGEALFINHYTASPLPPAIVDYNLYFSTAGAASSEWIWRGATYLGYQRYRTATGLDGHSPPFSNPRFNSIANPPKFDLQTGSPAIGAGTNLGAAIVGTADFAGNPRVVGGLINLGAYQQ